MIIQPFKHTRRIIISPGEFYISTEQEVISTLLGSCVATCLYDPVNKVIGMNHFLLAYRHNQFQHVVINSQAGRYGIHAMELLINGMLMKGAEKKHLKAKCFGGGDVLQFKEEGSGIKSVGAVNVEFIHEFLLCENIPLVSSSLGGKHGMNIHFFGDDYAVYMKKITYLSELALQKEEEDYWHKSISEHEQESQQLAHHKCEFWT